MNNLCLKCKAPNTYGSLTATAMTPTQLVALVTVQPEAFFHPSPADVGGSFAARMYAPFIVDGRDPSIVAVPRVESLR